MSALPKVKLERFVPIAELCAMLERDGGVRVHPRTMRRRILRLHRRKPGDWMQRTGDSEQGAIVVSVSGLQKVAPSFFRQSLVSAEDVHQLREEMRETKRRVGALAHRTSTLWKYVHGQAKRVIEGTCADSGGQK